jgi:hypothetical protein
MSGVPEPHDPEQSRERDKVIIDPVSRDTIYRMGLLYLFFTVLFFYLLVATWPVLVVESKDGHETIRHFKPFNLLGVWCAWAPDRQMLFTVMMAGALGSLAHSLTSFADYVGNKELSANWIWFFILRIPIGIAIAVLFYFIIRGGLIIPTVQVQTPALTMNASEATLYVNPYSIAAFSALAGMFSRQATDKLAAVFDVVFAMKKPVEREGALGSKAFTISPAQLTKGKREDLTVTGSGFTADTKARINGKDRPFKAISDAKGTIALEPEDVARVGKLEVALTNPSFKGTVEVVETSTVKPVISATDPKELTKESKLVTVIGQGLGNCTVTVNGNDRNPAAADNTRITIKLETGDFAAGGDLKLGVRNPDGASAETTVKVV